MCSRPFPVARAIRAKAPGWEENSPSSVRSGKASVSARNLARTASLPSPIMSCRWRCMPNSFAGTSASAAAGFERSCGSCATKSSASTRNPSTPRASQKRITSAMASIVAGSARFSAGCCGRKWCSAYCRRRGSQRQAGPPKTDSQLFGGDPSGCGSAQT